MYITNPLLNEHLLSILLVPGAVLGGKDSETMAELLLSRSLVKEEGKTNCA
jgi:hypothetical protein